MERIAYSLAKLIDGLCEHDKQVLVAIDGRCASGKTTLAAELAELLPAQVVHMDDFYVRAEKQRPEPGGNIDLARLKAQVLEPLSRGEGSSYRPFCCRTQSLGEIIRTKPCPLTIIEGAYSCHPALRSFYRLRVFLSVDKDEQLKRLVRRNGEEGAERFEKRWIPLEEQYFSACGVEGCCHLSLTT